MSILTKKHFSSEPPAFEYLESTLWPDGPVCPHCGVVGKATKLKPKPPVEGKRSARLGLGSGRERVPKAIHGESWDRVRAWPYPAP